MATSRRVARVSEQVKREVSQMLLHGIKDDRVGSGMVSVTNVVVSGDLQHAKIYVSIYGTDEAKAETMEGLKAATGYVRSELGHRMRLRRTPEVVFIEDRSLEEGSQVISLLERLSRERHDHEAIATHNGSPDDGDDDYEEMEDLDEDLDDLDADPADRFNAED